MGGVRKQFQQTLALLGVIVSATAVINLIQAGFHVHLNWGFSHFIEYYRQIAAPIMDVLQWPLRYALERLNIAWTVPQWLKDAHVLCFVLAGVYARGWTTDIEELRVAASREAVRRGSTWYGDLDLAENSPSAEHFERARLRKLPQQIFFAFWTGFTAFTLVQWAQALTSIAVSSLRPVRNRADANEKGWEIFQMKRLATATLAAVAAVIVFYVGNALAPQLGF